MNTDRFSEFLALAENLNYSRTAEQLYISQPILTKHIQELEDEFGTQLFVRSSHGVALTASGVLLRRRAAELLAECDGAMGLIRRKDLPTRGSVRILCDFETSCEKNLASFLRQFGERYPEITMDFSIRTGELDRSDILSCDIAMTLSRCAGLPAQVQVLRLASHGSYAFVPGGSEMMSKSILTLPELAGQTAVVPERACYHAVYETARRFAHEKLAEYPVGELITALYAVQTGRGILLGPRHLREIYAHSSGNIFMIGISNIETRFDEYIYYNRRMLPGPAQLFFEEFTAAFHCTAL